MSNLDIIREKLDGGQFTDLEELASGLLAALEGIEKKNSETLAEATIDNFDSIGVPASNIQTMIAYWTDEFAELPQNCAHETYAATLETPAEFCEEDAVEGSEYCKEHGE